MQKYWFPIEKILRHHYQQCDEKQYKKILEIGPGITPFSKATHLIDTDESVAEKAKDSDKNYFFINICVEKFPFSDFFFDFGYSRHTFEDIWNPLQAFIEMSRTCRSGFIETPSPLVELTKGVDSGSADLPDPDYRGYVHHRYIIWTDSESNTLYFLPKMPIVEHLTFSENFQEMINFYLGNEYYWNNYYEWDENKKQAIVFLDFEKKTFDMYLTTSILKSIEHTTQYIKKLQ